MFSTGNFKNPVGHKIVEINPAETAFSDKVENGCDSTKI